MNNRKIKKDPFEKYLIQADQDSNDPYTKYAVKDEMESYDPQALRTSNTLPADKFRQIAMMPTEQQKEAQNQLIEGSREQGKGFVSGAKEKFLQQIAALKGKEREPAMPQNSKYPEWMKSGEMLGHFVGGLPLILGGSAAGGAVGGLPGAIIGGASMGFGTTSGDVPARAIGALEGGATSIGKEILKTPQFLKALFTKSNPEKLFHSVQKGHDILHESAVSGYEHVGKEILNRGVPRFPVSPKQIDEATQHMAKTKANAKLIKDAKNGDYEAIRQLQSDLGKEAEKLKSSDSFAERNLGKEMFEQRQGINDIVQNHLKETGHKDLAEQLKKSNDLYAKKHDIYYDHNVIGKMVHPDTRKIPKNPMNIFSERSVQLNKLIKEHPEIAEEVELLKAKKKIAQSLKTGKNVGIGALALFGGKKGYDFLNKD